MLLSKSNSIQSISLLILLLILLFLLLPSQSCKQATEPRLEPELALTLEDVSCTEAWMQLKTTNLQLPTTINVLKNNTVTQTFSLSTQDTLLYIDSLLPNQTYKFKVVLTQNQQPTSYPQPPTSNEVTVTTMDTTSQEFSWEIYEYGIVTNVSRIFDVAIIDENNIWAVGEIYMNDSLGNPDPNAYNAVHWDGTKWELKRIPYIYNGQIEFPTIRAICAFSNNDIWFGIASLIHWDGIKYNSINTMSFFPALINKMWGSSGNDFYIVGNNGNIAHWDGVRWRKIESGTALSLSDIQSGENNEIYICGWDASTISGIILKSTNRIKFNKFAEGAPIEPEQIFNPKLFGEIATIWYDKQKTLYAGGSILYQNKFNRWDYVKSLPENYLGGNVNANYRGFIGRIKGNASNDMWIAGDRNTLRHFNGVSWKQIGLPYNPDMDLVWRGIDCKDNVTVVVGSKNRRAIIMLIKR